MSVATLKAFAGRDFRVARSYRIPFVGTILAGAFTLVTFRFIARLVGDAEAIRGTGDYFAFVVVGMVTAHVVQRTLAGPATSVRLEQVQGTLEVLATRPVSPLALAAGWSAYPMLEGVAAATILLAIGWMLGLPLTAGSFIMAIGPLALVALTFAAIGVLVAAVVLVFQHAAGLTRWIAATLGFVSGVFFPVALFPGWLRTLSELSPLTHALRVERALLLGGAPAGDALQGTIVLAATAAVAIPIGVFALTAALHRARSTGTIGTY